MTAPPLPYPNFGGNSPVAPPVVNLWILELFQRAMLHRFAEESEYARFYRETENLHKALHQHFSALSHRRAVRLIEQLWRSRDPFCLYLREFGRGARHATSPLPDTPPGAYESVTTIVTDDLLARRAMSEAVAPMLPVLMVANPAHDLVAKTDRIARLSLSDASWSAYVWPLVQAARVIVLYFDEVQSGLQAEIEMIREAGRGADTLVVCKSGSVGRDPHVPQAAFRLEDGQDDFASRLREALDAMLASRSPNTVFAPIQWPDRVSVPHHIVGETQYVIRAALPLAIKALREADHRDAHSKLRVALSMAYWGDDLETQCLAQAALARVFTQEGLQDCAVPFMERCLELAEAIIDLGIDVSPRELAAWTEDCIGQLDTLPASERAAALAERAGKILARLESSAGPMPEETPMPSSQG